MISRKFEHSALHLSVDLSLVHLCHHHVVWGPIDFVPCIDGIPPITRGDQAPLLERLVDCMSGTVSLNEGELGKIGE